RLGILSTSAACPQRCVTLWRICVETHKRSTNSPAILRICASLSCISNTSAAVIAVCFARRLAACIKSINRQAAVIAWCAVIMLRRATNVVASPNLRHHDQTETRLSSRVLPDLRVSSIASSALHSMHPIGVRQHVPTHQSKYDEHNRGGHDPHHTHFGFFIVSFILVRHLFLLNCRRLLLLSTPLQESSRFCLR